MDGGNTALNSVVRFQLSLSNTGTRWTVGTESNARLGIPFGEVGK